MLKKYVYNLPFIIVFVLCCLVPFFFNGTADSSRLWDDYYLVGIPEGTCSDVLSSGYFSELETVSSYNTGFEFNDFGEQGFVMLGDMSRRFIEGDPRVDELMSTAGKYFSTKTEEGLPLELVYIKSKTPSVRFYFHAKMSYGKQVEDWIFPDFNIRYRIAAVFLFAVCWFFGIMIFGSLRAMAFLAGLPWMAVIVLCSPDLLASSVLNYIMFILTVKEIYPDLIFYLNYREIRINRSSLFFVSAFIVAMIASAIGHIVNGITLPPFITSIIAELILTVVYYSLKSERVRRQEHRLFFPIKITAEIVSLKESAMLPTAAAAAAIILLPLFALFITEDSAAAVPVPYQAGAIDSWSWENVEYLDQVSDGLPDVSDLLTHTAFQQGFMYGRDYSFPSMGEKLTVGRYVTENSNIVYKEICVQEFTEDWYISIIKRGKGEGLSELLLSRQKPVGVNLKSSFNVVPAYSPLGHIIISLSALLPILGLFIFRASISLRRKGQEA